MKTNSTRNGSRSGGAAEGGNPSRGSRLYLLRQATMPDTIDGAPVSRARQSRMLAVLRIVDDHARARSSVRLKINTVADCLLISRRTVERAIRDLESTGLLAVRRRRRSDGGRGASEYAIDWQALRALQPIDSADPPMRQADASPRHTDDRSRHGDGTSRQADAATMRQGDATIDRLPDRISSPPPPPERECAPGSQTTPGPSPDWREVEGALVETGLADAAGTARAARDCGYSPGQVLELVAEFNRRRGEFVGEGALAWRIVKSPPTRPVADGWPGRPPKKLTIVPDIGRYTATWSHKKPSERLDLARRIDVDLTGYEGHSLQELPASIRDAIVDRLEQEGQKVPG